VDRVRRTCKLLRYRKCDYWTQTRIRSSHGKAVEISGAADLRQVGYATARRAVREVPEIRTARIADQVGVANDRTPVAAACPIMAGLILAGGKSRSVMLAAGQ